MVSVLSPNTIKILDCLKPYSTWWNHVAFAVWELHVLLHDYISTRFVLNNLGVWQTKDFPKRKNIAVPFVFDQHAIITLPVQILLSVYTEDSITVGWCAVGISLHRKHCCYWCWHWWCVRACVRVCVYVSDVHSGVYSGVSRRTLWNTGSVVNDIFMAAWISILVHLLCLLTLVMEFLQQKYI